jgi:hypothetical protein
MAEELFSVRICRMFFKFAVIALRDKLNYLAACLFAIDATWRPW